jgi:hypothetical protein
MSLIFLHLRPLWSSASYIFNRVSLQQRFQILLQI